MGAWPPPGTLVVAVPGEWEGWPRGSQEKVCPLPPEHKHLFPHIRPGWCMEQVHKREERAGWIFPSFSLCCLPFSLPGLVSCCPLPVA